MNKDSTNTTTLDSRVYISLPDLVKLRYEAKGFSFLPRQPVHSVLTGRKRSKLRGRGLDFIELRHYRPGDDIRTLDWRVTNRTKKPHVRVYAEEKDRSVYLLVDQRLAMFFGSQWKMKSVIAAELAALSAWRTLSVGDRVGAIVFNDFNIDSFTPSRSETRLLQCFHQLIKMNQSLKARPNQDAGSGSAKVALKDVLYQMESRISHDSLVIIISDFADWDEPSLKSVKRMSQHNDLIAALVSDELEENPARADELVVSDGRYQLAIDGTKAGLLEEYQKDIARERVLIRQDLRKHGIPLVNINTSEPVIRQIQAALGGMGES